jgi:hypothetical protein
MPVRTAQKAFPSAIGAGAYSLGGSGGQVIHVTTLNWTGPGSLKEAIQTAGPRIIVFDVSGEIDATSEPDYSVLINGSSYDNITLAGQSAPPGGITIKVSAFIFDSISHVICRYIRFRQDSSIAGVDQDSLWMLGGSNIIYDHCTFSHGNDEAASFADSTGTMTGVTMQHCLLQDSKTGTIMGVDGSTGEFSCINNVFSGISHRFCNTKGRGRYDIINNVVYNWKSRLCRFQEGGEQNLINNYYKPSYGGLRQSGWYGTGSTKNAQHKIAVNTDDTIPVTNYPVVYAAGSLVEGERETPQIDDSDTFTAFFGSTAVNEYDPVPPKYFTNAPYALLGESFSIKSALQAYSELLLDVGANKTLNGNGSINQYQDSKDAAEIAMIIADSYSGAFYDSRASIPYPTIPQNIRPVGYYNNSKSPDIPEEWFDANMVQGQTASDLAPSGYTFAEEFLNQIDQVNNAPVITLIGPVSISIEVGNSYNELGATATDVEDGDLTGQISINHSIDVNTPGTYPVTYSVTDSNGASAQATRLITVFTPGQVQQPGNSRKGINKYVYYGI